MKLFKKRFFVWMNANQRQYCLWDGYKQQMYYSDTSAGIWQLYDAVLELSKDEQ